MSEAPNLSEMPVVFPNTVHETLNIRQVEATPDRVVLEMDVGPDVHQPMGMLHGGVSAILAESAASIGAWLNCRPGETSMGTVLNISHLRGKTDGTVTATGTPFRKGRSVHVWGIEITDEEGRLVAVARCTVAIRPIP
ncbi:MAG TPA: PaaI family thioesterase [Actinomycetota bacterium]|nr:PaaI family thioesterase [Actinomycetota bacterium]